MKQILTIAIIALAFSVSAQKKKEIIAAQKLTLDSLNFKVSALKNELNEKSNRNNAANNDLQGLKIKLKRLQNDYNTKISYHNELVSQIKQLETEIADLKAKLENLNNKIEKLVTAY